MKRKDSSSGSPLDHVVNAVGDFLTMPFKRLLPDMSEGSCVCICHPHSPHGFDPAAEELRERVLDTGAPLSAPATAFADPSRQAAAQAMTLQSNAEKARRTAAIEAARWVAAVTGAPLPNRLSVGSEEAQQSQQNNSAILESELQQWLRSGELLCAVANRVRPGVAQSSNGSSTVDATGHISPFKCMGNISSYVAACKVLNVPAQDLFEASDLHEGRNMRAVVRNIHSLGRIAQLVESFDGPVLGARLASRNERQFSEQQLAEARALPRRLSSGAAPAGGVSGVWRI